MNQPARRRTFRRHFTASQVRSLITGLADQFPGSDLTVEAVGTLMTCGSSRRQPRSVTDAGARFTWGVQDLATVAAWHPRLQLTGTWYSLDSHRDRWSPPDAGHAAHPLPPRPVQDRLLPHRPG